MMQELPQKMYTKISSLMSSAVVTKFVNIGIAKKISFVLVIVLLIVNALNYIDSGLDPCRGILRGGILLDKYEGVWQPHGCMLHKYKARESNYCLKDKKIAFVGDSRMRELMFAFIKSIDQAYETPEGKIHSNIEFAKDDLRINFYWVPELNETSRELFDSWRKNSEQRPHIVFQSAAAHTIKRLNGSEKALLEYSRNFTDLISQSDDMIEKFHTKIFWILQEPVFQSKLHESRKMITNTMINKYNEAVLAILTKHSPNTKIRVVESFKWLVAGMIELSEDGLHLPQQALKIESSILLNYLCNNQIHPIDGTCCQASPSVTAVQILLLLLGISCMAGTIGFAFMKFHSSEAPNHDVENGGVLVPNGNVESLEKLIPEEKQTQVANKPKQKTKSEAMMELSLALAKFSLILLYFYICDRTNLFMKGNKHFTHGRFFLPLLYVSLLGLFGIIPTSQTALLNRDQTDEWKGWMQLIILIYHMSGASVNVPIYMHIRILVAMYLFMTGYGHFSYFWHKGDYSLYRLLNVVFRLNFLTVALCLAMDRSYQFYYFVPMCTFWFVVLYIAMAMWPRANAKMLSSNTTGAAQEPSTNGTEKEYPLKNLNLRSPYAVMAFKLALLFVTITILFVSQSYYEAIFSWWPAIRLFELPEGSVREWWFRCQLDRYAMLHGAVLCFIYLIMKKLSVLDDKKQGCLFSTKTSFITTTVAFAIVIAYTVLAAQCTNKVTCNRIHSYASIFPITAFVVLRNVPGYLRSGYSAFFAWFGKISLELFIGQYHIWLAADTKGMLVLVSPEWPTLNLVITSFIFVCIAHEINAVTGIVTKHVLGPPGSDNMKVLLRLAIILISICAISFIQNTFNPPTVGGV